VDTIFKFQHSILFTLRLEISKLTKVVVLNSLMHGRFWQFVYKEKQIHSVCHLYSPQKMQNIYEWLKFIWHWWMGGDYNIQRTNFCRITTCNERCINRVHLTFSLYTNCQNRPCIKEFNTTTFVNLLICNVNVNRKAINTDP
jgi:hypothetical protein